MALKDNGLTDNGFDLGQLIGKIEKSFSIKNDYDETVNLTITFDYGTMPNAEIVKRLVAKTVVDFQNGGKRRGLPRKGLLELDGITIQAIDSSKKVKTRAEQIRNIADTFINNGVEESKAIALAEKMVDNPSILNELDI